MFRRTTASFLSILLLSAIMWIILPAHAFGGEEVPSDRFWNPFRGINEKIEDRISNIINEILEHIKSFTGRTVSAFKIPDPTTISLYKNPNHSYLGFRRHSAYRADYLGMKAGVPPLPITDTWSEGDPCGGKPGDPYWANDCSCRCSRGGIEHLDYEVSDRCPEDDNLACEDCRKITRHDNRVTTVKECREGHLE